MVSDDGEHSTSIEVGNDTGRTLEVAVPWGDQTMAQAILTQLQNFHYQPFSADGSIIDPSVEVGDAVTVAGIYSGIFQQAITFGSLGSSEISAPGEEEVDNEYQYQSPQNRQFERKMNAMGSRITQTAEEIRSEVYSKTETDELVSSEISQTAENLTINFTNELTNINSYIRVENGTIILGIQGNEIELRETNNKVSFVDTGTNTELAYISNNRFYMPNATVTETMNFGGYQADATSDGIAWKWVGRS